MPTVNTEWSETWQPNAIEVAWAQRTLNILKDGGTMVIPRSQHIYMVSHTRKTLTLISGDPNDPRNWHRMNVVTFKRLGYAVLDATPVTAMRN